ncbi:hypothetical protein EVAR_78895_1 [Eumeta japonica]|uniref:Uncharacterized protein n=1 Tax=Eumeta variegata TaxID=151549 RepID=A0A4C1U2N7_EUMVA|nr:hypothetical protein EVAR_78895_1 [Eumeta japonica]
MTPMRRILESNLNFGLDGKQLVQTDLPARCRSLDIQWLITIGLPVSFGLCLSIIGPEGGCSMVGEFWYGYTLSHNIYSILRDLDP